MSGDSSPKELEKGKDMPFIVLSPVGNGGWDFWSKDEMITLVIHRIGGDPILLLYTQNAFISLEPAWAEMVFGAMGLRHPEHFSAALAPLGGEYIYPFDVPENICDLKDVPVRAFHGGNDFMVPAKEEQELVDALIACGGNAQFTVKPDAVIPVEEYSNPELYDWLLAQSKE